MWHASLGDIALIVTCGECSTSFQLDESRIPPEGARVRCSRCKHAFFLPNPTTSQTDAVHSIAQEAATDPTLGMPNAAEDLTAGGPEDPNATTWDGLGGEDPNAATFGGAAPADVPAASAPAMDPPAAAPAVAVEPELDEEDWQFSEEIRNEGDDVDDDPSDLEGELGSDFIAGLDDDFSDPDLDLNGQSAGGDSSTFGEGYDSSALNADTGAGGIDVPPPDEPEIATVAAADPTASSGLELDGPPTAEPVRDESSFGSVDDFSSLMEDDDAGAAPDLSGATGELGDASELDRPDDVGVGTYSGEGTTDDLGDPESWDLVGSDALAADAKVADLGAVPDLATALHEEVDSAEFFSAETDETTREEFDLATSSWATGPVGHVFRAAGWLAAAAAVSALAFLALQSEWNRFTAPPELVSAFGLEAQATDSGWVDTSRAGPVLRFRGEIRNPSGQATAPGIVQLALLDARGVRLAEPIINVGVPLDERVLRESAADVLLEQAATASRRFSARPLAAGETRAFEAVLLESDLPFEASRFKLELIDAEAASSPDPAISAQAAKNAESGQESNLPDASASASLASADQLGASSP